MMNFPQCKVERTIQPHAALVIDVKISEGHNMVEIDQHVTVS